MYVFSTGILPCIMLVFNVCGLRGLSAEAVTSVRLAVLVVRGYRRRWWGLPFRVWGCRRRWWRLLFQRLRLRFEALGLLAERFGALS